MRTFPPIKPTILVVDDTVANLSLMAGILQPNYTVKAVNRGEKALALAKETTPDLILLDISMPDMDGYQVCRQLKSDPHTHAIPVIFLTSRTDEDSERIGMDLGAVDYVSRPITPQVLLSRVRAHLVDAYQAKMLRINNEYLEYEVSKRARQLQAVQDVTIFALASLAETRDNDTGNHLRRTQHYIKVLATHLLDHPRFSWALDNSMVATLVKCAPLHDIGKVGIPDHVLLKPGRLTPEEMQIMQQHPVLGKAALIGAQRFSEEAADFLETAIEIVYSHHERWDGRGYPEGLAGEDIPVAARLMAVADVYDALISDRVYKKGMLHGDAVGLISGESGTHFDPDVVEAFLQCHQEFHDIARRFSDASAPTQLHA